MSLHCPATLLIARHGDADYRHQHVLSDDGGWLTDTGREQVLTLVASLADENIAAVHTSGLTRAVESGALSAGRFGVHIHQHVGLGELRVGRLAGQPFAAPGYQDVLRAWIGGDLDAAIPGSGESGHTVLERYRDALETIADQHRGETVLVFSHGGVMSFALPRLAHNAANDLAKKQYLPNAVPARVEIGDDGMRIVSWPGKADKSVI